MLNTTNRKKRRLTVWLTPYQAAALERLRIAGLPVDAEPLPAQRAVVMAILHAAANDKSKRDDVAAAAAAGELAIAG